MLSIFIINIMLNFYVLKITNTLNPLYVWIVLQMVMYSGTFWITNENNNITNDSNEISSNSTTADPSTNTADPSTNTADPSTNTAEPSSNTADTEITENTENISEATPLSNNTSDVESEIKPEN